MRIPKISAISEDLAFDRITSSIGTALLGTGLFAGVQPGGNCRANGRLESLTP